MIFPHVSWVAFFALGVAAAMVEPVGNWIIYKITGVRRY